METAVYTGLSVFAVLDGAVDASSDGLIAMVCRDVSSAEQYVQHRVCQEASVDRIWGIAEFPVCASLELSPTCDMLFVVYERDAAGIRPVHLYASESLARQKVGAYASAEAVQRVTDELTGTTLCPRSYWWESCPLISESALRKEGLYGCHI